MPTWLVGLSIVMLAIMLGKAAITIGLAARYHRRKPWLVAAEPIPYRVTAIIPAFNEEATIANCLAGMARQTYPHFDVLVVDDGSSDNTRLVAEAAAAALSDQVRIQVISKTNGGKAAALNYGLLMTPADVVLCVDADSQLAPDAVEKIVLPFSDPEVGAVGGMVKVANQRTLLGRQQAMEYISGLSLQRAAFAELDSVQVLSGAISAFRRDDLRAVGGYPHDTIVEDFDITMSMHAADHRVVLQPDAVAYTEGPLSMRDLRKQRYRWTYGGFQVLAKYRQDLFTSRHGSVTKIGLPYFAIFPWFDVLVSIMMITTLGFAVANGNVLDFLGFLAALSVLSFAMNFYALKLAKEPMGLAVTGLLMPLYYAHVLTWTTARAGVGYLRRRRVEWDSLVRGGENSAGADDELTLANLLPNQTEQSPAVQEV